jgi:hypothetical protein
MWPCRAGFLLATRARRRWFVKRGRGCDLSGRLIHRRGIALFLDRRIERLRRKHFNRRNDEILAISGRIAYICLIGSTCFGVCILIRLRFNLAGPFVWRVGRRRVAGIGAGGMQQTDFVNLVILRGCEI